MILEHCTSCNGRKVSLFSGPAGEEIECPDCALVELKTLCSKCLNPLTLHWPSIVTFGGERMKAVEALQRSLLNDKVLVCCDSCISSLPDVTVDDFI